MVSCQISANEQSRTMPTQSHQNDYSAWTIGIGVYSLDSEQASLQGIGDQATFLKLGWAGQSKQFTYGIGLSGLLLDDRNSFSVLVDGPFSGTSVESSDADAIGGYGELGYSYNFDSNVKVDLLAGLEFINASRGIANCIDCPEEDIDLDSGLYIEPKLAFIQQNGLIVSLSYRKYLNADINGGVTIDFAWQSF